jgi:hypothetical protein
MAPLGVLWKAAINPPPTYGTPTSDLVAAAKQFDTIPPIDTSGGQNLGGPGVGGYGQENLAPPAFAAKCKAEGGVIGNPVYDRTKSRVPTSEGGWTCRTQGNRCFDLLTYSGGEYRGGESACPEQGLRPAPLIPAGGGGKPVPTKAPSRGPAASTWDGTWTSAPSTVTCDVTGTLPDGTPVNQHVSQSGPPVTFVVSGDTVQGGTHIPPGGHVQLSVPAGSGTVTLSVTFVHDANGGAHYSGTINLDAVVSGDIKEHCSGAVSGTRN